MKTCLTGGIACGKSLLSRFLRELGVETLDADDVVHELLPDPAERRRLAAEVFADPAKRKALEARLHPLVKARIEEFLQPPVFDRKLRVAIVPLLFEVHWDADYDIICCIASSRENQISRMMSTRGYTREEAEARLAAQLPVAEKAARSHYVIANDGSPEDLRRQARAFVDWLSNLKEEKSHGRRI